VTIFPFSLHFPTQFPYFGYGIINFHGEKGLIVNITLI